MSLATLARTQCTHIPVVDHHMLAIRKDVYKALTDRDFDDYDDFSDGCECEEACGCRARRERFERSPQGLRIAKAERAVYAALHALDIAEHLRDVLEDHAELAERPVVAAYGTNDLDLCVRRELQSGRRAKLGRDGTSKKLGRDGASKKLGHDGASGAKRGHADGKKRDARRYHNGIIREDAE